MKLPESVLGIAFSSSGIFSVMTSRTVVFGGIFWVFSLKSCPLLATILLHPCF